MYLQHTAQSDVGDDAVVCHGVQVFSPECVMMYRCAGSVCVLFTGVPAAHSSERRQRRCNAAQHQRWTRQTAVNRRQIQHRGTRLPTACWQPLLPRFSAYLHLCTLYSIVVLCSISQGSVLGLTLLSRKTVVAHLLPGLWLGRYGEQMSAMVIFGGGTGEGAYAQHALLINAITILLV